MEVTATEWPIRTPMEYERPSKRPLPGRLIHRRAITATPWPKLAPVDKLAPVTNGYSGAASVVDGPSATSDGGAWVGQKAATDAPATARPRIVHRTAGS